MKKYGIFCLVLISCICLAFTAGIFIGRNLNPSKIQLSDLSVPESSSDIPPSSDLSGGLLDLNAVTADQLQALPQIGPVLAQRIIEYRNANGPFASVNDLLQVDGIGVSRLNILLQYITVEGAQ